MEQDIPPEDQIDEEAAIWCARALGQSSEPFDERAFQDWIEQSESHRRAFDSMSRTWARLDGFKQWLPSPNPAAPVELPATAEDRAMLDRRRMLAAVAGAAVLSAGGYAYYAHMPRSYTTEIGNQSLVRLDDGSRITLDGATGIRFRENAASRTVWLDQGRASFNVAHDPLRPFSVHVRDKIVVAVGTSFSVERLQGQVRANLVSGRVEVVNDNAAPGTPRYQLLAPGDHFIALDDGSPPIITHNNSVEEFAWTKGILNFDNEDLPIAVERMNRYSSLQIDLAPGLATSKVSGVFKAGETQGFVAAVCELLDLRAEQVGNTIRLTTRTT